MTSAIDPTKPTTHVAYTADVRNNFQIAANEITALQNGTLSAPLSVSNGGTGVATLTANAVLVGNGIGNVISSPITSDNGVTLHVSTNQVIGTSTPISGTGSLTLNANTVAPPANTVFAAPSLEILGANGAYTSLCLDNYSTAASSNYIAARRARGTAAAPTAVQSGDSLSLWGVQGYDGANYSTFGATMIAMSASENFTGSARGTGITFATTPTGTLASVNSLILQGNAATFSGNVTLAGDYLYFLNATGTINGPSTGPYLYADQNSVVAKLGTGSGGFVVQQNGTGSSLHTLDSSGNLTIFGATATKASGTTWANPSSREIKQDIQPYGQGLQAVLALNPVTYHFNEASGFSMEDEHIGLVHDETVHMPEMHRTATIGAGDNAREVDALDCSAITFALVNAIKELKAELDALKAKVGV